MTDAKWNIEHLVIEFMYKVGDLCDIQLRKGTDKNGIPYRTNEKHRELMFALYSSQIVPELRKQFSLLEEEGAAEAREYLREQFRVLLGIWTPDEEQDK